jgi:lactoylglutathione lyase
MASIMRHVAIKIAMADLEEKKDFYMNTVGMKFCRQSKTRDHVSCHLTDGYMDFTLVAYDEDDDSVEAKYASAGPCIHHTGFETDDLDAAVAEAKAKGYRILGKPETVPVKMTGPGDAVIEFARMGYFQKTVDQGLENDAE